MIINKLQFYQEPVLWLNIEKTPLEKFVKPTDLELNFSPISGLDPIWKTYPVEVQKTYSPFLIKHVDMIKKWLIYEKKFLIWSSNLAVAEAVFLGLPAVARVDLSPSRLSLAKVLPEFSHISDLISFRWVQNRLPRKL